MYSRGVDLRITHLGKVVCEADSEHLYFMHKFGGYANAPDWVTLSESYCSPVVKDNGELPKPDMRVEYRAKKIRFSSTEIRRFYVNAGLIGVGSGVFAFAVMSVVQLFGS